MNDTTRKRTRPALSQRRGGAAVGCTVWLGAPKSTAPKPVTYVTVCVDGANPLAIYSASLNRPTRTLASGDVFGSHGCRYVKTITRFAAGAAVQKPDEYPVSFGVTQRVRAVRQARLAVVDVRLSRSPAKMPIFAGGFGFGLGRYAAEHCGSPRERSGVAVHGDTINPSLGFVNRKMEIIFGASELAKTRAPNVPDQRPGPR